MKPEGSISTCVTFCKPMCGCQCVCACNETLNMHHWLTSSSQHKDLIISISHIESNPTPT